MTRSFLFFFALVGSTALRSADTNGSADRSTTLDKRDMGPSTHPDSHKYVSHDYEDAAKKIKIRLSVPEGLAVVRGILVVGPWSGGDTRDLYKEVWYREFLHLHGFAFFGAEWSTPHTENFKVMQHALKQIAQNSKHPELVHAPYVATGFSSGGSFANRLLAEVPDKLIAAVIVGSQLKLADIVTTDAHRGTPVCIINGEHEDDGLAEFVAPVLAKHRPNGALWGWLAVPGIGHERDAQEVLAMPMLDAAVWLRYPADGDVRKGPVKLKPVDAASGWVADNSSWKSGLAVVAPAVEFQGGIGKSSWILNEDIAFIYRAYATHDRPLTIKSPRSGKNLVWDAGSGVTIVVDDSRFAGWKKLALYDGATKVSELEGGKAEFTLRDLKAGYHAFSVLGTDGKGNIRSSDPVLVVVRKSSQK